MSEGLKDFPIESIPLEFILVMMYIINKTKVKNAAIFCVCGFILNCIFIQNFLEFRLKLFKFLVRAAVTGYDMASGCFGAGVRNKILRVVL